VWGRFKFCGCGAGANRKFQPAPDSNMYVMTRAAETVEIGKEVAGKSYMLVGN